MRGSDSEGKVLVPSKILIGLSVVLVLVAAMAVLAVNPFPVISNDSVFYIEHSLDMWGGGFVEYGYRQFGYPLYLAITRTLSDLVGAEPLLAAALVQRILIVAVGLLAWRKWKSWSLPLVVFLLAAETLALGNFLLTEGIALPVAVLLGILTVDFVETIGEESSAFNGVKPRVLAVLIVLMVVSLFALRFTYAVFAAVPLILWFTARTTPYGRLASWALAVTVVAMGVIAVGSSVENGKEFERFTPSARAEPVRYYFAWQQVFTVHPENPHDPQLAAFYDNGVVHDFSREVGALELPPDEEKEVYDAEIKSMLEAAGMTVARERMSSFLHAMVGGRLNDVESAVEDIVDSRRLDLDRMIYLNEYAATNGPEAFVDKYNNGQTVEALVTDPIGKPLPIAKSQGLIAWLLPVSLLGMVMTLFSDRLRTLGFIGLVVVISFAAGMGWILADNYRFLTATSGFGISIGVALGAAAFASWKPSEGPLENDE